MAKLINLEDLMVFYDGLFKAFDDCSRGKCTRSRGPIDVFFIGDGKYQLLDGYHRLVEFLALSKHRETNGRIKARVRTGPHTLDYAVADEDERWHFDASLKYGGLEELADEDIIDDMKLAAGLTERSNLENLLSELLDEAISPDAEEQIRNASPNDVITVYHGTPMFRLPLLINGFDATQDFKRDYRAGAHRGIFVTADFELAKRFGGGAILELQVRAKNLHGTDYGGNISRELQRRDPGLTDWAKGKFPNSFRPHMAMTMLQDVEPQALLVGLVKPSQITRVWVKDLTKQGEGGVGIWHEYTREEFLKSDIQFSKGQRDMETFGDAGIDLSSPKIKLVDFVRALLKADGDVDEASLKRTMEFMKARAKMPEDAIRKWLANKDVNGSQLGPKALDSLVKQIKGLLSEGGREMAAAVIVQNADNNILLLQRGDTAPWMPGKWNLPGGKVDEGESPMQAAEREAREETTLTVSNLRLVDKRRADWGELFIYHTRDFAGVPSINWESKNWKWEAPENVFNNDLVPGIGGALGEVIESTLAETVSLPFLGLLFENASVKLVPFEDIRLEKEIRLSDNAMETILWHKQGYMPLDKKRVRAMVRSLKRGKDLPPLVLDSNNQLIDGHHRYAAYRSTKTQVVPVVYKANNQHESSRTGNLESLLEYLLEENDEIEDDEFVQIGPGNPEYEPSWDYEPVKIKNSYMSSMFEEVKDKADVLSNLLGLGKLTLYFAEAPNLENHLARYVNGTYSNPIIILSNQEMHEIEAELTLFHELGHAYVDSVGEENIPQEIFDREEEIVETFARLALDNKTKAVKWLETTINFELSESTTLEPLLEYLLKEGRTMTDEVFERVLEDWVERGIEADEGPHWFPPKELFRYREYMRPTRPDLKQSMGKKGFDPEHPLWIEFGKDGHIKIGEGNHRLKTAIQLGLDKVPVVFHFVKSAIKTPLARDIANMRQDKEIARKKNKEAQQAAFDRKYGIDKQREQSKREEEQRRAALSPEERAKEDSDREKTVDELMDLLGF